MRMAYHVLNQIKLLKGLSIVILLLYIFFKLFVIVTFFHDIGWDESVYLGMGKYIYSNGEIGLWEEIRPLFLPLLLGLFWKLKLPYILVIDLIMFLFTLGTIFLCYKCCKELLTRQTFLSEYHQEMFSILSSFLLMLSTIFFNHSFSIMTEIPAAFFILLAFYLYLKEKNTFFIGLAAAAAFLTKFTAGIIIVSIGLVIILDCILDNNKKDFLKKLMLFALGNSLLIIPFFIFNSYFYFYHNPVADSLLSSAIYPLIKGSMHQSNIVHAVSNPILNLFFYPIALIKDNSLFIVGLMSIFFYVFTNNKDLRYIGLSSLFYLTYLTLITNKQSRFIILILPLIIIASMYTLAILLKKYQNTSHNFTLTHICCSLMVIITLTHFILPMLHNQSSLPFPFIEEKPEIINQYYQFPTKSSIPSPLLTTDPRFAAYNDLLFIPVYNNATDALFVYQTVKENAQGVIYSEDFYPCSTVICEQQKQELYTNIMSDFSLVYEASQHPLKQIFVSQNNVILNNIG